MILFLHIMNFVTKNAKYTIMATFIFAGGYQL